MYACIDGWMDGVSSDEWVYACMDGWIGVCMDG